MYLYIYQDYALQSNIKYAPYSIYIYTIIYTQLHHIYIYLEIIYIYNMFGDQATLLGMANYP